MRQLKAFAWLVFTVLLLTGIQAFAQAVAPAAPTFLDGILKFIEGLNPAIVSGTLVVLEALLRIVPSAKALSVLVPVKYGMDGVAKIFVWASGLLAIMIASMNNVTPPAA